MVEIANKGAQIGSNPSVAKEPGVDLKSNGLNRCRSMDDIRRDLEGVKPGAWGPLSRPSVATERGVDSKHCGSLDDIRKQFGRGPGVWEPPSMPSETKPLPSAQTGNPELDKTLDRTMQRILVVSELSSSLSNKVGGDYSAHAVQQVLAKLSPEERKQFESYIDTLVRRNEINNSNIDIRMPEVSEQQLKLVETIKQRAGVVLDKAVAAVNSTMSEADKSALLKERAEYSKQMQAYKDAKEAGIDMAHPKVGPLQDQFDKRMYQAIKTASSVEVPTAGQTEAPTAGQKIQIGTTFGTVL